MNKNGGRLENLPLFLKGENMTISEAISTVDKLKPNTYEQEEKIRWLSFLDMTINKEIIYSYAIGNPYDFKGYDGNTPIDTVLIAESPYDEIYIKYIETQIDYYNGDTVSYENSCRMFNALFEDYKNYYSRNFKSEKTKKLVYF